MIGKGRGVAKNEDLLAKLDQQLKAVPEDAPAREDLMRKRKATKDALDKAKKAKSDQSKKSGKKQQCCLHPHSALLSPTFLVADAGETGGKPPIHYLLTISSHDTHNNKPPPFPSRG